MEPDSSPFQFCLELLAFAKSDQVIWVFMTGDDHPSSEPAEASFGAYMSWAYRKYLLSAFQFNIRPRKKRELTELAGNHLLLPPCTPGAEGPPWS